MPSSAFDQDTLPITQHEEGTLNLKDTSTSTSTSGTLASCFRSLSLVPPFLKNEESERACIAKMRKRILDEVSKDKEAFDQIDIEQVTNNDEMIVRYLLEFCEYKFRPEENVVDTVSGQIVNTLQWRKEFGVNSLSWRDIPREIYESNAIQFYTGVDGRLYILIKARYAFRYGSCSDLLIKMVLIHLEDLIKTFSSQHKRGVADLRPILISDLRGCSLTQVDLVTLFKLQGILMHHYPHLAQQGWLVSVPWFGQKLFNTILKSLPSYCSQMVKFMSIEDCINAVGVENIATSMGGKYRIAPPPAPEGLLSLKEYCHKKGMSAKDASKIQSHLERVKEWEVENEIEMIK